MERFDALQSRIGRARDWSDLERVLDEAQELYERKQLSVGQVEALAVMCSNRSRKIPESVHVAGVC